MPVNALRGYSVEYSTPERYVVSKKNKLYYFYTEDGHREFLAEIPLSFSANLFIRFRLMQRLFRLMFYNVIPIGPQSFFVSFGKRIGLLKQGKFHEIKTRQPIRILRNGAVFAGDGKIYWGEYFPNENRDDVAIYRLDPETLANEIAYKFPAGEIRHIHGLYIDPYQKDAIWVSTGDKPSECRLSVTTDYFRNCKMKWGLAESWRAVSLLFTRGNIYYGTDAEFEQNYIYKIDRHTGKAEKLAALNGPCFYSKKSGKFLIFSVTAELCPSQTDNHAAVYIVDSETDGVEKIFEARKDFVRKGPPFEKEPLPVRLFMYGNINFSGGEEAADGILASCIGLRGYDNRVLKIKLSQ